MWRRIEVNARVDHPVERVFAYLANPLLWHEFAPACVFRRQIGDLPLEVGTRWMATDQIGPFRFHFVDELAELEPDRRVVWLSSTPWIRKPALDGLQRPPTRWRLPISHVSVEAARLERIGEWRPAAMKAER